MRKGDQGVRECPDKGMEEGGQVFFIGGGGCLFYKETPKFHFEQFELTVSMGNSNGDVKCKGSS